MTRAADGGSVMDKHTPKPWLASFESVDPEWAVVTTVGGSVIANVNADFRQQANARLIAASPDMLEALKEIEAIADNREAWSFDSVRRIARAAIAKAEGGAA